MGDIILLPILIESCASSSGGHLNTGSSSECLEGVTNKLVLAKSTFRFTDVDDFKNQTSWQTAIQNKDIVPLFSVYEVAEDNTEATKYESGSYSVVTEKEVKKMTCESYLSICSHKALKSYQSGDYTQVFEITTKGEVLGVYDNDGVKVKGQDISEFDVAIRSRPTNDKPGYSMQTITYRDFEEFEDNGIIIKEAWDIQALQGVFGLQLAVSGSPTSSEIIVSCTTGCGSTPFDGMTVSDWTFTGGTISTSTYSATTGLYTLTGTGLASGNLSTGGVITIDAWLYESNVLAVTI